jgi:hypothetical protein
LVHFTIYCVVAIGLTEKEEPVASDKVVSDFLYQFTVPEQPLATNTVVVPEQMESELGDIDGGAG